MLSKSGNPRGHVLVVASDASDAEIVRDSLNAPGYESFEVEWVGSLSEALDRLGKLRVVVVLLELFLPDSHGIETFDAVFAAAPRVPVLIVCRSQDERMAQEALQHGARDYIPRSHRDSYSLPRAVRSAIAGTIAAEVLLAESHPAKATLDSIGDGVLSTDLSGKVTYLNAVAEKMTGWSRLEATGRPLEEVFRIVDSVTRQLARNPLHLAVEQDQVVGLAGTCLLMLRDGSELAIEDSAAPIRDANGRVVGAVLVFRNVGEARALALRMSQLAYHDILTGLPNRILFNDRLTQAINAAHRNGTKLAVLFIDLDDFKLVNDSWGHLVGDAVLKSVAGRLVNCLRSTDTVTRYGGDEFVILLPEIAHVSDAARVAQKLFAELERVHTIGECELQVKASIGISIYPDHGQVGELLMHKADTAMYHAKKKGGPKYQFAE